jgi:uncharacterized surface protein with fasciclin (FAS1) repeats
VDEWFADLPTLSSILKYHLLSEKVSFETFLVSKTESNIITTVNGAELFVSVSVSKEADGVGEVMVNSAKVTAGTGIVTDKLVIHTIDTVLIPPTPLTSSIAALAAAPVNNFPITQTKASDGSTNTPIKPRRTKQ